MAYKIKRPVMEYYIPLSDSIEKRLDAEWRAENEKIGLGTKEIGLGTKVKLRDDVLQRHARSVPAHLGYTKEQFAWRDTLDKLKGKIGVVSGTFPNSSYVNVDFKGHLIGINKSELTTVEGKGWHGDTPGHKVAAGKHKTKDVLRTPMARQYPRLRGFVNSYLDSQWDEAARSPQSMMESMGWKPHRIDKDKFYEIMNSTLSQYTDDIVKTMVLTASNDERNDDFLTELLVYELTGDLPDGGLPAVYQQPLATHLGSVLSDGAANWIAEGFHRASIERKEGG